MYTHIYTEAVRGTLNTQHWLSWQGCEKHLISQRGKGGQTWSWRLAAGCSAAWKHGEINCFKPQFWSRLYWRCGFGN